jgi:hypothetical protein
VTGIRFKAAYMAFACIHSAIIGSNNRPGTNNPICKNTDFLQSLFKITPLFLSPREKNMISVMLL